MPRLIALYNNPADPDGFDAHYRDVHTPIIQRYPNLRQLRLSRPKGVAGQPVPYHLMAEMTFATDTELDEALGSDAGRESAKDLRNFAQAGVTLFVAPDEADA
ncbi:MAG TPA: EthD family reductase [Candidatus Angelobacter sp.]|nr:EthD family reductase [Candidatus Angelobacter sp.]